MMRMTGPSRVGMAVISGKALSQVSWGKDVLQETLTMFSMELAEHLALVFFKVMVRDPEPGNAPPERTRKLGERVKEAVIDDLVQDF